MEKSILSISKECLEIGDCLAEILGFVSLLGNRYFIHNIDIKAVYGEHNVIMNYIITIYYY